MSAVPSMHSNEPLTLVGARMHYSSLPVDLKKKLDSLEKKIIRSFNGKRTLGDHFEETLESVFNLRLQLFFWLSQEELTIQDLSSELQPQLDALCKDEQVGQIGFLISRALQQNQLLVDSLADKVEETVVEMKKAKRVPKQKLEPLLESLVILGTEGHAMVNLIVYSLYFEIVTICALQIQDGIIKPGNAKLKEFVEGAETIISEYCKYASMFRDNLQTDKENAEQRDYKTLAVQHFNSAFAEDEPDYSDVQIVTPNPDYKP